MTAIEIGVDVGNYDTKTQNCIIASGFKRYEKRPKLAANVMEYKGEFFVPDISERMPYVIDKTENDQCLILTLFGIVEELLFMAHSALEEGANDSVTVQEELKKYRHIKLGVGLPPGHFDLADKTNAYYKANLSGTIRVEYKKYSFEFEVDVIRIFPQDFVAIYKNKECKTSKKKRYYIVGIGGGTVDIVPVVSGQPDTNNCFSLDDGTRVMYNKICADVQRSFGQMLDENLVEDVLMDEETVLSEDIVNMIKDDAVKHYTGIINGCLQRGIKLSLYPVVFFGGGALLLSPYINTDKKLIEPEILQDISANAKAYAAMLKLKVGE